MRVTTKRYLASQRRQLEFFKKNNLKEQYKERFARILFITLNHEIFINNQKNQIK